MDLNTTKLVFFGVSKKARFKPVSSATETCISLVAKSRYNNVQKAYNKGTDQSACMRTGRLVCTFVVCIPPKQVFSRQGPGEC